jgi:CBS-domain-containing membrane protein
MLVQDVMTSPALTVRPETPIKTVLTLLDQHSVTMLPVATAAGVIVGVVSEADLVRETLPRDPRTHLMPFDDLDQDQDPRPHTVGELMNHRALTVTADTDLAVAAELMTSTSVKSLPVIDAHHRVVGVVSRRDIIRVLARTDDVVEREVDDLFRRLGVDWLVDVEDGVVTVAGPENDRERALAMTAAATVPGVLAVVVSEDPASTSGRPVQR